MTQNAPGTPGLLSRVRRRVSPTYRTVRRLDRQSAKLTKRVDALHTGQTARSRTVDAHDRRIAEQGQRIERIGAALKEVQGKLGPLARLGYIRDLEHTRHGLGIGAIEHRMGQLEQLLDNQAVGGDESSTRAAGDVLEAVRREHEQIRMRMQIIGQFEERLRRVEAAVESYDDSADVRRVV